MIYKFNAFGHPSVLARHRTTFEFTKDSGLSLRGDCIVGVKADFDLSRIKKLVKNSPNKGIKITIETVNKKDKITDSIYAEINADFDSDNEMVIRKTGFLSRRTFAVNASKAAFELNKNLADFLRIKGNKIKVTIRS